MTPTPPRPTRLNGAIRRALLATALIGLAPAAAMAQEQDPTTLDRITVTGSNIPRTDTETPAPVQVVTREDIDRTGKTSVGEYLQTLTADGSGSIPKSFGNGFAAGGTGISLRGLGAGSTLVLLNGRRMASYGLADDGQKVFTDLGTIPLDAVERVEVLKDGASAIYGSDAIAGVVNIILREDFEGATLRASFGRSEEGDGDQKKATLTAGTGNLATDGWNAFFSLDVGKDDAIMVRDRANRKWIGTGDIRPWGYDLYSSQNLGGYLLPGAINDDGSQDPGNALSSPTGSVRDPNTLQYVSLPGCEQFSQVTPGDPEGGCVWDTTRFGNLMPEEKYVNLFARGTFAISDRTEFYTEFGYSKKQSEFASGPSGVSGTWGYPGGVVTGSSGPGATVLGPDHPDNPFPGQAVRLRYSAFDVGPRVGSATNEFARLLAGFKGSIGEWDYDVGYLHSQSELVNKNTGFLRYSAVQCVLGNADCPLGVWRIGQNAHLTDPSVYAAISPTIEARAESSMDVFDVKANRSLTELPGGPLGLALGAEWRRVASSLTPTTYTDQGDIIGLGYSAYDGVQNVYAAYAELLAPLHDTLELSAALRADKYESGETATKPKAGFKWSPADWIAVRGTYAEGFRAPNPAEAGDGGLAAYTTTTDPVRCPDQTPIPGATAADCAIQVAVITRPNPSLEPEESKSYTFGLVLQPTASTTLTVDAWQIKRSNEINQESVADAIAKGNVVRSDNDIGGVPGTGTLQAVDTQYINSNSSKVSGVDADVRQRVDLGGAGVLNLDLQWSHIRKFERSEIVDGEVIVHEFAGTHGNCDVTNCIGTPKDRINLGATWDVGAWSVSAVANYFSSFDNKYEKSDEHCAMNFADGSDAPNGCKIPSFTTVDLSANWQVTDAMALFGSVQNVADRIAPLDPLTYGAANYNPLHYSGAIGRYFTVGMRYTFN